MDVATVHVLNCAYLVFCGFTLAHHVHVATRLKSALHRPRLVYLVTKCKCIWVQFTRLYTCITYCILSTCMSPTRNLEYELASGVINVLKQYGVLSSQDDHTTETDKLLCWLKLYCTLFRNLRHSVRPLYKGQLCDHLVMRALHAFQLIFQVSRSHMLKT